MVTAATERTCQLSSSTSDVMKAFTTFCVWFVFQLHCKLSSVRSSHIKHISPVVASCALAPSKIQTRNPSVFYCLFFMFYQNIQTAQHRHLKMCEGKKMEKAGGTFNNHSGLASRRVICRTSRHKTAEIFTFTYSGNGFIVCVDVGCVGMN